MSTYYYCVKDTDEVIGTHKDWLELKSYHPNRFKELNNTGKIQLIRVGYGERPDKNLLKKYGLVQTHTDLCHKYMQHEVYSLEQLLIKHQEEIETAGPIGSSLLSERIEEIRRTLDACTKALSLGSTKFPTYDDDGFELYEF